MVEVSQEMVGLEQASAELDKLIASDAQSATEQQSQQATEQATTDSANQGTRAAQPESTTTEPDPSKQTDTPAAADKPATDKQQQQQQTKPENKEPSPYEKNRRRQDSSWKQINEEKAALKAERERLDAERAEFDQAQRQAEAQYTPDQYDQAAKKFEEQGKFDLAELAKQRADELRKNPPPSPQQQQVLKAQQAQHQAKMKEWWGKAAVDYPSVAKEGTPENAALKTFIQGEPEAMRSPKGMYYAARLVNAETAAARVPTLEKELGDLRAKVKELEALTAPGGPSIPARGAQTANQSSDEQQFADLERMAMEMGTLR